MIKLIDQLTSLIDNTNVLVILLFGAGIIFTIHLKAYNLNLKQIFKALSSSNRKSEQGVTGLQALMISTASRIGNGNIAGVSSAIMVGGPGALFWMWVTALLGMATAFVEGVLSQLYKTKVGNIYEGGTPFYISKGIGNKKLAITYAIVAIITFGTSYMGVQSNTIAANFYGVAGKHLPSLSEQTVKLIAGVLVAIIMTAITVGGIKSIGKFATAVMPVMGTLYLLTALVIIVTNFDKTGAVWSMIFKGAFNTRSVFGGLTGFTIAKAVQQGASRGVFSNEAGLGSASFAAAASNSKHPVKQGLLQSFSTFLDTIIICTASGLIILYAGTWMTHGVANSGTLIQASIASKLGGEVAAWLVFVAILLFGLTTTIGLYYYAETSIRFLTHKKSVLRVFQFTIAAFLVYSSIKEITFIWNLATVCTFLLATLNIIGMFPQIKTVKLLLNDYKKQIKDGKDEPIYKNKIKNPEITLWK